jgi:hypothetical protein
VGGSFSYGPGAGTVLDAGTHTLSVTFTPSDTANYESATASVSIVVTKAAATVTLSNLMQTYTGGALSPSATTGPAVNDPNYEGAASGTFVIAKAAATVTLGDLAQTYTGSALSPSAMTGPAGLSVIWTGAPQTTAGSYPVTASVTDPNYEGSASGTFVIAKATATVSVAAGTYTYDGVAHAATGSASGAGGSPLGPVSITYNGAAAPPVNAGSYAVVASYAGDANHEAASASATLVINRAALTIRADDTSMLLNGTVPPLTATYTGFVNGDTAASLDSPLSLTTATGSAVGQFPIVASAAADANYAITFTNGTLTVGYAGTGACLGEPGHAILQPINVDGTSVFKKGSTVPAKFRVCDASGASVGAPGTVSSFRLVQTVAGTVTTAVNEPVDSTTPFAEFRWDALAQQWIFNMATRGLTAGRTYVYDITLGDGSVIRYQFGLR